MRWPRTQAERPVDSDYVICSLGSLRDYCTEDGKRRRNVTNLSSNLTILLVRLATRCARLGVRLAMLRLGSHLSRIFGEGPNFQISDGPSESPPKFETLDLGCIDDDFCK